MPSPFKTPAARLLAVACLAACGGQEADDRADLPFAIEVADAAPDEAAPAEPPFPGLGGASEETRPLVGKPDASCAGVRPADGPRSVAGLALGMTAAEAERVLACDADITRMADGAYSYRQLETRGFDVRTEIAAADGVACATSELPHVTDVSRNRSMGNAPLPCEPDRVLGDRAKDVTEEVRLRLMGAPGEEVVHGIVRRTRYEGEGRPGVAAVRARLTDRYGQPTGEAEQGGLVSLSWQRTPSGALVPPGEADPLCSVAPRLGGGEAFVEGCGVQVAAALVQADDAPLLEELRVAVLDEDGLLAAIQGTNDRLAAMRAARDADAVRGAASADDLDL